VIPLRSRDGAVQAHTLVSEADYETVAALGGWCLQGAGYVWRGASTERPRHLYLHRLLAGCVPGDGLYVDHINGDRLDNRRENLRIVTPAQSRQNTASIGGSSRYRGVFWDSTRSKWTARAQLNRRGHQVGRFGSEAEAHAAVVAWRLQHMPFTVEDGR
jgi:hypothetical protein